MPQGCEDKYLLQAVKRERGNCLALVWHPATHFGNINAASLLCVASVVCACLLTSAVCDCASLTGKLVQRTRICRRLGPAWWHV